MFGPFLAFGPETVDVVGMRTSVVASATDVALRLVAQLLSTMIIARILPAEVFGLALMVLTVIAFLSALISLPLEEALAQRRRIVVSHLETTLTLSWVLALIAILLLAALGPFLETATGVPGLAVWLVVAGLFLVGHGPGSIARALSRRQNRFVDLAFCQATSTVIACAVAVPAALAGWGVLALILQRMLPVVLYPSLAAALAVVRRERTVLKPHWSADRFQEIFRFSWLHLTDVAVRNATPTLLTYLVNARFGAAVLGELSIAMRLVDPLRSGIASIGHILVFSALVPLQAQPQRLIEAAGRITVNIAILTVPAFLGLAASAPLLLPLLVGPGWDVAVPLARLLCVAAAIGVPMRYLFSAYVALGRPELGLAGSVAGLATMLIILEGSIASDHPHAPALAVIGLDTAISLFGVAAAWALGGGGVAISMIHIGRIWIAGATMAVIVSWLLSFGALGAPTLMRLFLLIGTGVLVYYATLLVVGRSCLRQFMNAVAPSLAKKP